MTEILLHSPPQLSSHSRSITCANNDAYLHPVGVAAWVDNDCCNYSDSRAGAQILGAGEGEKGDQVSVLAVFVTVFRKSLVGCSRNLSGEVVEEAPLMEIGVPTNVRHVAHVTFDRFDGFLGLPVEFEPEVPRRPPSASTRVFGVSPESMQISFDSRGNCVPTILLMMQKRLYSQGGLQSEGIFRINAENSQEEFVRERLNNGVIPDNIDVHCLAGLIKAWFRELPMGILDSLPTEQVMLAQSEDECAHLVKQLPRTEAALLDWAVNLMADVAQVECLNKMNARNIAMVFAPNMTQMSDPLTALMFVVQVMNVLKALVVKTLRTREDSVLEEEEHSPRLDEDDHQGTLGRVIREVDELSDGEQVEMDVESMPKDSTAKSNEANCFLGSILHDASDDVSADRIEGENAAVDGKRATQPKNRQSAKTGQPSMFKNVQKERRKPAQKHSNEAVKKSKELNVTGKLNSQTERVESWR